MSEVVDWPLTPITEETFVKHRVGKDMMKLK